MDLHTPDYAQLSASIQLAHSKVSDLEQVGEVLKKALASEGPYLIEIDMPAIGTFKTVFAGPPTKVVA
ncbi:hypothetical protein D3H34_31870 [Acidovorax cavernicola]|uniref:Uncharacterized protein n=1 Tax=Acidovorax cavernicola TaxID=1675792 RepID=A0A9X8CY99_9BURK|nr:hypothetical protein D3H34_31870 [Acidovorax cavernicola]